MDDVLNNLLDGLDTFAPQHYGNMTVIGLNIPENNNIDLMSLKKGLELGLVEISEVNESGSVGEVKVKNNAVTPLLILDGEEIIGSKQNRIANATIIIEAKSEKIIPVSCTEAGRWQYNTDNFKYSTHMATSRVRRDKLKSVSNSLRAENNFRSDQHQVWNNISITEKELNVHSNTSALHDAYQEKTVDIDKYRDSFGIHENQNGLMVFINGRVVGLELIYNNARYREYHDKLVESYIIDAIGKINEETQSNED
ncbi:MAG: hypothetical protein Q4Q22_07630, partial [Methanosphaera sp.]|nr:hypothetical protein [Methanosphaera sp.]